MRKYLRKNRNRYVGITVFCGVFAGIYEYFSHGVYSNYMILAFLFPFLGVVLPYTVIGALKLESRLQESSLRLYQSAVLTWMMGSIFWGVLEIYGTTNELSIVYPIMGSILMILAFLLGIIML